MQDCLTVNGHSMSDPVLDADGKVDKDASRRVEVKFRLKDEEMIQELNKIMQGDASSVWIRQRRSRGRILRRIRVLGRRVLRKSKLGLMEASGCLGHGLELFVWGLSEEYWDFVRWMERRTPGGRGYRLGQDSVG